jgi:hypothetical protein
MTRDNLHVGNISGVTEGMNITWKKDRHTSKLPGIGIHHKPSAQSQLEIRAERLILNQLHKIDRGTINNVYHVSEFQKEIQ